MTRTRGRPSLSFKKNGKQRHGFERITILTVVIFVLGAVIVLRLFDLQVLRHDSYRAQASGIHDFSEELQPKRGEIFVMGKADDAQGSFRSVATNMDLYLLYADPSQIEKPAEAASKLAPILEMTEEELLSRFSKPNDMYEPIKHYLDGKTAEAIGNLGISGLHFEPENMRFYPDSSLFSHILGFVGFRDDGRYGQYGLEEYFQGELAGEKGLLQDEKDAFGRWIATADRAVKEARNGSDLILTVDYVIQFNVCQELKQAVKDYEAESGTAIVMEPQTGKILAMCGYPDFDPNNYSQAKGMGAFVNPAISRAYEPGSTFKVITMASALDLGEVTPATTYEDIGYVKADGYTIRNSDLKANGVQTMIQVLEKSLNTGAIFVAQKVGVRNFRKYLDNFGFGKTTGIELAGEAKGDISSLKNKRDIYLDTASFGQGITATPLQMIQAFAAIANQGKLMKPYIVDKIVSHDGGIETVRQTEPQFVRQVVDPSTAVTLSAMLVSVVKDGHAKRAGIDGYYVAGKTGTAQVPSEDGAGYSDRTIHSFIGFAPATNPRFVALVKFDNPKKGRFAESTAVPVFARIAKLMLNYYQVPPDYQP